MLCLVTCREDACNEPPASFRLSLLPIRLGYSCTPHSRLAHPGPVSRPGCLGLSSVASEAET